MVNKTLRCGIGVETVGDRYFDEEVGQRLKAARQNAGWSQSQVAGLLDLSFQQVQKYETGANRLPANKYQKLSMAIGFDVSDLLVVQAEKRVKSEAERDAEEVRVLFNRMSGSQRKQIIGLCNEFARKT